MFFDKGGEPAGIAFTHLRDHTANQPLCPSLATGTVPVNDRHYGRNCAVREIHRDIERAAGTSELLLRKLSANERQSHPNLADGFAMPPGTLAVSYVPGYHVPLNQTEGRRQIHLVPRETAVVGLRSFPLGWSLLGWSSRQSAERIETFELQTAVIAKKFMQTGDPQHNRGIVVATLNSGTRTSRAPHIAGHLNQFAAPRKQQFVGFGELDGTPGSNVEIPEQKYESPLNICSAGLRLNNPGDFLLSHTVSRAVPSAPAGLTSVFGMGTGVTLPTKSPENLYKDRRSLVLGLWTLISYRKLNQLSLGIKDQRPKS